MGMMKVAALAALVGSAAAFAPASTGKASTALSAFENELGVQDPLGFYDPLGLLDDAAVLGPDAIPQAGLVQIIAFVGLLELGFCIDVPGTGNEFVGDFRNGAIDFGWDKFDEETKFAKRAVELNNGRAAMMGILGLMIHE